MGYEKWSEVKEIELKRWRIIEDVGKENRWEQRC